MSAKRDRTRRETDPPLGVDLAPPVRPGAARLRDLEEQANELRGLHQDVAEARAAVVQAEGRERAERERADKAESLLAAAREELSRLAADAMLPRSAEVTLARRAAQITFEMTSEMRVRISGYCRGSGPQMAGSMAELATKLLKNRG